MHLMQIYGRFHPCLYASLIKDKKGAAGTRSRGAERAADRTSSGATGQRQEHPASQCRGTVLEPVFKGEHSISGGWGVKITQNFFNLPPTPLLSVFLRGEGEGYGKISSKHKLHGGLDGILYFITN